MTPLRKILNRTGEALKTFDGGPEWKPLSDEIVSALSAYTAEKQYDILTDIENRLGENLGVCECEKPKRSDQNFNYCYNCNRLLYKQHFTSPIQEKGEGNNV